jgi:hypothetical protein
MVADERNTCPMKGDTSKLIVVTTKRVRVARSKTWKVSSVASTKRPKHCVWFISSVMTYWTRSPGAAITAARHGRHPNHHWCGDGEGSGCKMGKAL